MLVMAKAISMANLCGLATVEEALLNYDRSLMHFMKYEDIHEEVARINADINEGIEICGGDAETFWDMSLQTANEVFKLGLNLEQELLEMQNDLDNMPEGFGDY